MLDISMCLSPSTSVVTVSGETSGESSVESVADSLLFVDDSSDLVVVLAGASLLGRCAARLGSALIGRGYGAQTTVVATDAGVRATLFEQQVHRVAYIASSLAEARTIARSPADLDSALSIARAQMALSGNGIAARTRKARLADCAR